MNGPKSQPTNPMPKLQTNSTTIAGSSPVPCSTIPAAQVLVYQPELTHSVWTDVMHRKRSQKSLEAMLRKGVRSGEYVGYRLLTIHAEYVGISWPNAKSAGTDASEKTP